MGTRQLLLKFFAGVSLSLLLLPGCGGGDQPAQSDQSSAGNADNPSNQPHDGTAKGGLPVASLDPKQHEDLPAEPEKGSPEWVLLEIRTLMRQRPAKTDRLEKIRAARHERNLRVIELATEAIAKTHDRPEQEYLFNDAVSHLMEARLQLAFEGDREHIDLLYEQAEDLYQRDPKSKAAADAAYSVARFAHTNARQFAKREPRWLEEFSRQARLFAHHFPHDESRAAPLLFAAGWSCDAHRERDNAIQCFALLEQEFPKTPQAQQAVAILRRLNLNGKPAKFSGPTIDSDFVNIDDYRGKTVLILFWATDNPKFKQQLPELIAIAAKYEQAGLRIIGVNLDEDESTVREFLKQHKLAWPQVFYPDPEQRRWKNPLVRHYGIRDIPMLWLIDPNGVVVDTMVDLADLEAQVRPLLSKTRPDVK